MSRCYRFTVTVREHQATCDYDIAEALEEELGDMADVNPGEISMSGTEDLYAGETADEFAERITKLVWKANDGKRCRVVVRTLNLDMLPWDEHELDEDDYVAWIDSQ